MKTKKGSEYMTTRITREYILQDLLAREYTRMAEASKYLPIDCIVDDSIDVEAIEKEADRLYDLYLRTGEYHV